MIQTRTYILSSYVYYNILVNSFCVQQVVRNSDIGNYIPNSGELQKEFQINTCFDTETPSYNVKWLFHSGSK